MSPLKGSLRVLLLYDVSEEIRLDRVRELLVDAQQIRRPEFRGPAPDYVRFAHPPLVHRTDEYTIKFYDYGVISVALEIPFEGGWEELVQLSSRSIASPEIERKTLEIARAQAKRIRSALTKPYDNWTSEDYYVVHLREAWSGGGHPLQAQDLMAEHGGEIAQILRGESVPLSDSERHEILQQWVSYYPTDLLVVAWMAAFLYDTPEGAAPALQLLEYANTQLIEFRYYDDLLTKELASVYSKLNRRANLWGRWRTAREAERLNRMRLEVIELTERVDNSIKFLSDMFYARAYRLAARKVGVNDYRDLVDEKLKTAADLYQAMVDEFHQARTFVLELMVVAILIIELVFLFRGKG
jgi:hypothetical protein